MKDASKGKRSFRSYKHHYILELPFYSVSEMRGLNRAEAYSLFVSSTVFKKLGQVNNLSLTQHGEIVMSMQTPQTIKSAEILFKRTELSFCTLVITRTQNNKQLCSSELFSLDLVISQQKLRVSHILSKSGLSLTSSSNTPRIHFMAIIVTD